MMLGHWPQLLWGMFHDHPHPKQFLNKKVKDVGCGEREQ